MFRRSTTLETADPDVWKAINGENQRQEDHIELIASENFVSVAVLEAQGSRSPTSTRRAFPASATTAAARTSTSSRISRATARRSSSAPSTPTCSRTPARRPTWPSTSRCSKPGDTVLGMNLAHGGHLTHGSPVNFSGKWFNVVPYGLHPETERIDYDEVERLAHEHQPKMIIAGASAYPRIIDFERFARDRRRGRRGAHGRHGAHRRPGRRRASTRRRCRTPTSSRRPRTRRCAVRAAASSCARRSTRKAIDKAVFPGLQGGPLEHIIAAKAVAFGEALQPRVQDLQRAGRRQRAGAGRACWTERGLRLVSGGTDNHLMLVDLRAAGHHRQGRRGTRSRQRASPSTRTRSPTTRRSRSSRRGIRVGSPAMTTRGFSEIETEELAHLIADVLDAPGDATALAKVRSGVAALTRRFPVYHA